MTDVNGNKPRVQLVVSLMTDGSVAVGGPLHDKILCYGLLGLAQDAIRDYRGHEAPQIQLASNMPPFQKKAEPLAQ